MLAVTGLSTSIVQEYLKLRNEIVARIEAHPSLTHPSPDLVIPNADRYILAAGVLHQKPLQIQTEKEVVDSFSINFVNVVRICEQVLSTNDRARICVIGSESGYNGSFDETYAGSKAAVHCYVENRKLKRGQQLVCVAPTIISDSGMTRRRSDYPDVLNRRRTVKAATVAEVIHSLFSDEIYLNNLVVRMG
jgi:short-subunit dehydrogenase